MLWVTGLFALALADEPASPPGGGEPPQTAVEEASPKPPGHKPKAFKAEFKPGKGVRLTSSDKRFELKIGARLQIRYRASIDRKSDGSEQVDHLFEVRRARLTLSGHLFGKHNEYRIALGFSPRDMGLRDDGTLKRGPLVSASLAFTHLRDANFEIGQFVVPFNRQRSVSSAKLAFPDRADVGAEFAFGQDLGIAISSDDVGGLDHLRYAAGVFVGDGRALDASLDGSLLYAARVEVFPMGIYSGWGEEGDLDRHKHVRVGLGLGYAFHDKTEPEDGAAPPPADSDAHSLTVDGQLVVRGVALEGAFFWRLNGRELGGSDEVVLDANGDLVSTPPAPSDLAGYGQIGWLLPKVPLEVSARYGQIVPLADVSAARPLHELGVGLNWYIAEHPFKVQAAWYRTWRDEPFATGNDDVTLQVQATL